jgi:hypothetical protein
MSTSSIAGQGDSRISASTDVTESHARYEAERAAARARTCGVVGCDGSTHEPDDEEDMHRFSSTVFDDGEVEVEAYYYRDQYTGSVLLNGISDGMTAAELRAKADLYDDLPTLLRQYADTLDARTVGALTEPFTRDTTIGEVYEAAGTAGTDLVATFVAALERINES